MPTYTPAASSDSDNSVWAVVVVTPWTPHPKASVVVDPTLNLVLVRGDEAGEFFLVDC